MPKKLTKREMLLQKVGRKKPPVSKTVKKRIFGRSKVQEKPLTSNLPPHPTVKQSSPEVLKKTLERLNNSHNSKDEKLDSNSSIPETTNEIKKVDVIEVPVEKIDPNVKKEQEKLSEQTGFDGEIEALPNYIRTYKCVLDTLRSQFPNTQAIFATAMLNLDKLMSSQLYLDSFVDNPKKANVWIPKKERDNVQRLIKNDYHNRMSVVLYNLSKIDHDKLVLADDLPF